MAIQDIIKIVNEFVEENYETLILLSKLEHAIERKRKIMDMKRRMENVIEDSQALKDKIEELLTNYIEDEMFDPDDYEDTITDCIENYLDGKSDEIEAIVRDVVNSYLEWNYG